jgi:putative nucleotidyltransferase with HDIG domain
MVIIFFSIYYDRVDVKHGDNMAFENQIELEVIEMLTSLVEEKDTYTGGHSKRVAMYASKIAENMGLRESEQELLYHCGLLHDIGKILTPDTILLKPAKYTKKEFDFIKKHPLDSEHMVSFLTPFHKYKKFIRHHHERYDGRGYPDGLKAEEIPLYSRILTIADAFDAMTTNRIYKHKNTLSLAIDEIYKCSGTQFDPDIVPAAIEVFRSSQLISEDSQIPTTLLDEQRYAFYFKDKLTSFYSCKYLDYFLEENNHSKKFKCFYFIQLHNMQTYNKKNGWEAGNQLLIEIALRVRVFFHSSFIFRIYGDDFVVLNSIHVQINQQELAKKFVAGFSPVYATFKHFDLGETPIFSRKELEKFLD